MGIEPTSEAWEASILPLYDARSGGDSAIIPKWVLARTERDQKACASSALGDALKKSLLQLDAGWAIPETTAQATDVGATMLPRDERYRINPRTGAHRWSLTRKQNNVNPLLNDH